MHTNAWLLMQGRIFISGTHLGSISCYQTLPYQGPSSLKRLPLRVLVAHVCQHPSRRVYGYGQGWLLLDMSHQNFDRQPPQAAAGVLVGKSVLGQLAHLLLFSVCRAIAG